PARLMDYWNGRLFAISTRFTSNPFIQKLIYAAVKIYSSDSLIPFGSAASSQPYAGIGSNR
ncbi:hypothetical protein, partial [Sutterella wadsworthensis]|uniref:hypothetical protein n=1 Tax=Sutterella wadsworthensis TaxID=40545 RepID=UPI0039677530